MMTVLPFEHDDVQLLQCFCTL